MAGLLSASIGSSCYWESADSIRDVIAFPKTQRAQCPLTDAPSAVGAEQLKELRIKLDLVE